MALKVVNVFQQASRRISGKVARFEKLLRDPDLAPYISMLLKGERPEQRTQAAKKPGAASGITKTIRSMRGRLPRQFTAEHVDRELRRANFTGINGNRNRHKAIAKALFKMAGRREIKRIKEGVGGKSNTYAWNSKK